MSEDLLRWRPIIPMGAIPMKEGIEEFVQNADYIAEVKYDGFRMLAWVDEGRIRFTTRSVAVESARAGDPWPTERTDNLPHLRDMMTGELYGTILDGEIWKLGCTSHNITSMVGGLPENSIENQEREGYVTYKMYDILQYRGMDITFWPYLKRRALLEKVYHYMREMNEGICINSPSLGITDKALVENYIGISEQVPHELKEQRYTEIIASGGEGMILKHKDSTYHLGKIHKGKGVPSKVKASSRNGLKWSPWVKYKKKDTFDCVVLGFSPATTEYKGSELNDWSYWEDIQGEKMILPSKEAAIYYSETTGVTLRPITKRYYHGWPGAIIFGQYQNGELVEVGNTSGISEDWLQRFKDEPEKYIGKVITVEAMERVKKTNALREPRFLYFREEWDKAPSECVME